MVNQEYQVKSSTGPCESYKRQGENQELVICGQPGKRRIDNGLDSGIHCDECWDKMILECRSRSW